MSIVRDNLMTQPGYAPYCMSCPSFARMHFIRDQFQCGSCGTRTEFEATFIAEYKTKWGLK